MEKIIYYKINRIKEPVFSLKDKGKDYKVSESGCEVTMNVSLKILKETEEINIILDILFLENVSKEILLTFQLEVLFGIKDFNEAFDTTSPNTILIPNGFLMEALQLCIGASRGMIALKTLNTYLESIYLPVYNVADLVARLKESQIPVVNG